MNGTYRKEGSSARITSIRGARFESLARESGVAGYSGGRFFSASAEASHEIPPELAEDARGVHERVARALARAVVVERLRAIRGVALHRFQPDEADERSWSETQALVHATLLARNGLRLSVLRGGAASDAIDVSEFEAIASALARASGKRRLAPGSALTISAAVFAAIAAELARDPRSAGLAPLAQRPHPAYPLDGDGRAVTRLHAAGRTLAEWPNVFRPSYRSPAVPALMHVEVEASESDRSEGSLVALEVLRPPHAGEDGVGIEALCTKGRDAFVAIVEISYRDLAAARASREARVWFPFHAGAWGRRVTIERRGA